MTQHFTRNTVSAPTESGHDALLTIRGILKDDPGYDTCCDRIADIVEEYFRVYPAARTTP
jgi:hypothetical protein